MASSLRPSSIAAEIALINTKLSDLARSLPDGPCIDPSLVPMAAQLTARHGALRMRLIKLQRSHARRAPDQLI